MSKGPSMQLYQEGILQGITVNAIPGADRPKNLDGTMVGDIGFDPLGLYPSDEDGRRRMELAEIKHGRLGMIAITGYALQEYATGSGVIDETPAFFRPFFHL